MLASTECSNVVILQTLSHVTPAVSLTYKCRLVVVVVGVVVVMVVVVVVMFAHSFS